MLMFTAKTPSTFASRRWFAGGIWWRACDRVTRQRHPDVSRAGVIAWSTAERQRATG
jgi:hypothetical protein